MAAASQAVPGEFDSRHLLHHAWSKKISRRKNIANAVFFLVFGEKSPRFCIFRNIQIHENDLHFRRYFYNCHRVELIINQKIKHNIASKITEILNELYLDTKETLIKNKTLLDNIATALIEKKILAVNDFYDII